MKYFDSILMRMNDELISLVENKKINSFNKLAVLGLDEYSFAVRTLLENAGYKVECYISEDADRRGKVQRSINYALSHYFNKTEDYIRIFSVEQWIGKTDDNWLILYASRDCVNELDKIAAADSLSESKVFCLYDWNHIEYKKKTEELKRMDMDELKSMEKDILFWFDRFCENNNLRYWLSGGSMLGAIRHKGFIPWDDDIDVFMPDVDYEKFLELFHENDNLRCQLVDDDNDVWGHFKFARLTDKNTMLIEKYPFYNHFIGVNVEILPIVGLPDNEEERVAYIRRYEEINERRRELFFKCSGDLNKVLKICEAERQPSRIYRFDNSEYVGVLGTGYFEKDCTTRSVYERTLRVPFEDIMVNVPQGYQEYLDNLYGKGWEEWPAEDKRTLKHNIEAYWL